MIALLWNGVQVRLRPGYSMVRTDWTGGGRNRWGMGRLLSNPEVNDRWYEVKKGRLEQKKLSHRWCFKNEPQAESSCTFVSAFNNVNRRAITSALISKWEACQAGIPARRIMA